MTNPLVSILIPCYNQGKYLNETLDSVLKQNYFNWECIIVDDGSTDETAVVATEWCATKRNFFYYYKSNGGISSARNMCLEKAKGEYIQWLDGDDFLDPNKLLVSINVGNISSVTNKLIVISNFKLYNEEIRKYAPPYCNLRKELFTYNSVLYDWEDGFTIPIHCGFFQRSLFVDFIFPIEVKAKEDWLMWIHAFGKNPNVFFIDEPLAVYRRHNKSMTMSHSMEKDHIAAFNYLKRTFDKDEYEKFAHKTMLRYYKSSLQYRKKYNDLKRTNIYLLDKFLKRAVGKSLKLFRRFSIK